MTLNQKLIEKSKNLSLNIYKITKDYPPNEIYGITSQIRRSSLSIHLNITEGYAKYYSNYSKKELIQFLSIAYGSSEETLKLLEFSLNLGYGNRKEINSEIVNARELSKLLFTLIKKIRQK